MGKSSNKIQRYASGYSLNEYLKNVGSKKKTLDKTEECKLFERYHNGDQKARDEIIMANLPLVRAIVKQYRYRGISEETLLSEGIIGMLKAIEKFDPSLPYKFISYGVWWIKQNILVAIGNANVIRIPCNQMDLLNKLLAARSKFLQERQRPATVDEIADIVGVSTSTVEKVLGLRKHQYVSENQKTNNDETDSEQYLDTVADESITSSDNNANKFQFKKDLKSFFPLLNSKEKYIIEALFFKKKTPREVSETLKIKISRLNQIKKNAFNKIKNSDRSYILKCYINKNMQETDSLNQYEQ